METTYAHIPYDFEKIPPRTTVQRSQEFYQNMSKRRSIRFFSKQDVPRETIENLVKCAGTAPSGAHKQPWHFCCIADPKVKKEIRLAAEKEEYESYTSRMSPQWLEDLKPIGTDWNKPFLEDAPWLIVVFKKVFDHHENGQKTTNYYVNESVGIACGVLISAIHQAGLVTLTHTPSPMNFVSKILKRPENERPFLVLPVGYPDNEATVPDFQRKELFEISSFYEKE